MNSYKNFDSPIEITNKCPFCGKTHTVIVDSKDFSSYKQGKPAFNAFPYLDPVEREQVTLSICPDCQEEFF